MANTMICLTLGWLVVIDLVIQFQSNVILINALENTDSDELDDYDRQHPVNVTVTATYTSLNVSWTIPPHENNTDITGYIVYYHKFHDIHEKSYHISARVAPNVTYYVMEGQDPGTKYMFYISANYSTNHNPRSRYVTKMTDGYGPENPCGCDPIGTVKTSVTQNMKDCNYKTGQCTCTNYTSGRQCDQCEKGYYMHLVIGCEPCGCDGDHAIGSCHKGTGGFFKICDCKDNFGGQGCENCADGYYMEKNQCVQCQCNKNSNQCHGKSGECQGCHYNTTGALCENCKKGYIGDPISAKNCTKYDDVYPSTSGMSGHTAIVIGVVGAVLAIVLIVLGVLFYRHWKRWSKKPLQFWTVELRDDHENVHFSGMMEQPEFVQPDAMVMNQERDKEVQYFEKDRGNRSSKRAGNSVYRSLTT